MISFNLYINVCFLGGDLIGHQVSLADGRTGVVVVHRPPIAFAYFDDIDELSEIEGTVDVLDSLATLDVSENAREIDCFGRDLQRSSQSTPLLAAAATTEGSFLKRAIFAPIPQVGDIALINQPVVTGVTMLDALAPIGQGQNMLLIGHDLSSMRRYAIDLLEAQKEKRKLIYAATTDDDEIKQMLSDAGLINDVTIVTEDGKPDKDTASKAAESTTIAAAACAMAESLARDQGADTIVIVDNIDQHKQLWDETTRVLVDVFGAEAVVQSDRDGGASSEMRAFYSSLIQRSAQYKKTKGGGSVTLVLMTTIPKMTGDDEDTVFSADDFANTSAKVKERIDILVKKNIPLTASTLRKIQIPVPSDSEGVRRLALQHVDDLISMSDGQIWLDERLENLGRRPPMDPQRSVTRVGIGADTQSRADAPAMRKIVEGLRLEISQAASMDGADLQNNATKKQLRKANALLLVMHQEPGAKSRRLSESCALLYAASRGYLDDVVDRGVVPGSREGDELLEGLLSYVQNHATAAVTEVDETNDLSDESLEALDAAIKAFFDAGEGAAR
jgi:F-type H+/Na+-transporting ATPase subunit alpha